MFDCVKASSQIQTPAYHTTHYQSITKSVRRVDVPRIFESAWHVNTTRMAHLQLNLLGGFTATLDGQPLDFRTQKIRALLCYLVLAADTSHTRDTLMGLLWSDSPQPAARNNLRVSLARLRKTLGVDKYLVLAPNTIRFNPQSAYTLDVTRFSQFANSRWQRTDSEAFENDPPFANRVSRSAIRDLQSAYALYHGVLLAGFFVANNSAFEEWLVIERERLHQQFLEISNTLAEHHTQHGAYETANQYLRRSLALEPWREEIHRALMQNLARVGERSAALQQYETCCRVLARELRVTPNAETLALFENILRGDLDPPPLSVNRGRRHNLPPLLLFLRVSHRAGKKPDAIRRADDACKRLGWRSEIFKLVFARELWEMS